MYDVRTYAIQGVGLPVPEMDEPDADYIKSVKQSTKKSTIWVVLGAVLVIIVLAFYMYPMILGKSDIEVDPGTIIEDKSIAVLPFVNMSNDPDQEYFSDGLSEELINLLTKIPELKVIARTSSFSFKGKNEDVRDIGQKLGVSYLLEGSVRKSGNYIRITAQLIKTDDGSHLWSETYDRQLIQIFAVQDEIAEKVVGQLKLKISGLTQQPLNQRQAEAHNLLLEANYIANHQQDAQEEVIELLEQAIGLDSTNARIWQRLSGAYLTWRGTRDSRMQTTTLAKKAARRAIELAPDYGHGYRALGQALFVHDWDFQEGEKMFRKAYQLDPEMFHALWVPNIVFGRYEEVILISKQGVLKDPLSSHDWWAFYIKSLFVL